MKNNILVIAPIMPIPSEINLFAASLDFLLPHYTLHFIDPLSVIDINLENQAYYLAWQHYLAHHRQQYDAFIGFSFGGVILQQCFPLFEHQPSPIVLFSTPTFADHSLNQTLRKVIELCENNRTPQALYVLYAAVYHPKIPHLQHRKLLNPPDAANRLINGLKRVLSTDANAILATTKVRHLHLIGEFSDLVNAQNVITPNTGKLVTVPEASMRVLEDNLLFCQPLIMSELGYQHE